MFYILLLLIGLLTGLICYIVSNRFVAQIRKEVSGVDCPLPPVRGRFNQLYALALAGGGVSIVLGMQMIEAGSLGQYPVISLVSEFKYWHMLVFISVLLILAVIDFQTQYLPDELTLPLIWAGLLTQIVPAWVGIGLEAAVLGAAVGYGLLWAVAMLYRLIRRRDGLGHGDMKLMAAIGAWFGITAVPAILTLGALSGLIWQIAAITRGRSSRQEAFAFGPWLILSAIIYGLAMPWLQR
jgi:prepilin signal peptidase PulO-like enzyme (type II secretory pathway)